MQLRIILFNILIVFFLLVTAFFPVSFLGADLSAEFWRSVWPFMAVVLLALGGVDIYFLLNRKFFNLLEKGEWKELAAYLSEKIYKQGKYSSRNVRFLAQSCLLLGDLAAISELEQKTEEKKPSLVNENVLIFGIARILTVGASDGKTIASNHASEFFGKIMAREKQGRLPNSEWVSWFYGFSLVFAKAFNSAGEVFSKLAADAKNPIVTGLSAFFLLQVMGQNPQLAGEIFTKANDGKQRVKNSLKTSDKWRKKAEHLKAEVHGAIVGKYLDEASVWLFEEGDKK